MPKGIYPKLSNKYPRKEKPVEKLVYSSAYRKLVEKILRERDSRESADRGRPNICEQDKAAPTS